MSLALPCCPYTLAPAASQKPRCRQLSFIAQCNPTNSCKPQGQYSLHLNRPFYQNPTNPRETGDNSLQQLSSIHPRYSPRNVKVQLRLVLTRHSFRFPGLTLISALATPKPQYYLVPILPIPTPIPIPNPLLRFQTHQSASFVFVRSRLSIAPSALAISLSLSS